MTYIPILPNPIEWNEQETQRCERCDADLSTFEINEEQKECDECIEDQEWDDIKTNYKTNN
jgi:hypothetical protein